MYSFEIRCCNTVCNVFERRKGVKEDVTEFSSGKRLAVKNANTSTGEPAPFQFFFRVPHVRKQVLDIRRGHANSGIGSLSPTASSPSDLEQIIPLKVTRLQYHTNVILKNSDND